MFKISGQTELSSFGINGGASGGVSGDRDRELMHSGGQELLFQGGNPVVSGGQLSR
jgi:hypothetical protein